LLQEFSDRFGKLPGQGQTLFDTHRPRVLTQAYGTQKIDARRTLMNIIFRPDRPIDALRIDRDIADPKDRAADVYDVPHLSTHRKWPPRP